MPEKREFRVGTPGPLCYILRENLVFGGRPGCEILDQPPCPYRVLWSRPGIIILTEDNTPISCLRKMPAKRGFRVGTPGPLCYILRENLVFGGRPGCELRDNCVENYRIKFVPGEHRATAKGLETLKLFELKSIVQMEAKLIPQLLETMKLSEIKSIIN